MATNTTTTSSFNPFETAIKAYLDKRADEDALFAMTYVKPQKSIKECCEWIMEQVTKMNTKREKCLAVSDEEVYGMAVHYYDEDDCKPASKTKVIAKVAAPAAKQAAAAASKPAAATSTATKANTASKAAKPGKSKVVEKTADGSRNKGDFFASLFE